LERERERERDYICLVEHIPQFIQGNIIILFNIILRHHFFFF